MKQLKEAKCQKDDKRSAAEKFAVGGAAAETVSRYGAAIKEHLTAYSGVDNEAGRAFRRSLSSVAERKVNPDFARQNIKQQSGFSAEIKTAARENAENILNKKSGRFVRTDDMSAQTTEAGHTIGGVNDQLFDVAEVDKNGFYIEGSARQLKYVGGDPEDCCKKLLSRAYDKYRQADAAIEIPKDFYDDVQNKLSQRIDKTGAQLARAERNGDAALAQKHREELARLKQTKNNLRQGKLTSEEAIEARVNPMKSTASDVADLALRSGWEGAKFGAAGSVVKGVWQNSESAALRCLSKSSLPSNLAIGALEVGKTFYRYVNGKIDGTQCLVELGEKGAGMTAASIGAGIGQAAIPIPVVGAMIGSMCGYTLSSIWYSGLAASLQEAKLAHEERKRIEMECQAAIEALREYRAEMEKLIADYFHRHMQAFQLAFGEMHEAFQTGDVDLMIGGANRITEVMGGKPLFRNMAEFEELMSCNETLIL